MSTQQVAIQNNKNISELKPFDVLCGRSKESYNNIGNRRFRILINLNLPRYLDCQSRNERSEVILSLTEDLSTSSSCIRFFKHQKECSSSSGSSSNNNNKELIELDFKEKRGKIAHALRDAASQHNNSNKSKEAMDGTKKIQREEETMIPLTNNNNYSYSNNFFPNNVDNRNNDNNNNNNDDSTIHNDIRAVSAPRNSSRYSMLILHALREEAVPNISPFFFNMIDERKDGDLQTNFFITNRRTHSLMSDDDIEQPGATSI